MFSEFIITDIGGPGYSVPDLGPKISKVNLHTTIWSLLEIYLESTESSENAELFEAAINVIEELSPTDLYNLLIGYIAEFDTSEVSLQLYAEKIVCFDKEEVYAR